jgi:hypothetical protein
MENVEIAQSQQYGTEFLGRVKFLPFVAADQMFLQCTISDVPLTYQIVEIIFSTKSRSPLSRVAHLT